MAEPQDCITCGGEHEWRDCTSRHCLFCTAPGHQGHICPIGDSLGMYPVQQPQPLTALEQAEVIEQHHERLSNLRDIEAAIARMNLEMENELQRHTEEDERQGRLQSTVGTTEHGVQPAPQATVSSVGPAQQQSTGQEAADAEQKRLAELLPDFKMPSLEGLNKKQRDASKRKFRKARKEEAIRRGLIDGEVKERRRQRDDEGE